MRCFQCQRYGHSKNVCLGQPTCPRCGESGHDSADCTKRKQCLNYKEARRVVLSRTPVSGKSYAGAARKSTSDKCIQYTVGTTNSSNSATPTNPEVIAKSKTNSPSKTKPTCVALQETFMKRTITMRVRGYNWVRRDVDGNASPTGGVCLFTSNLYPSNVVTLHTSLQAVAVRIHIHSLVTVCCIYLPPNDVVPQVDLNQLVSQFPALFILLGDFNGHNPPWGHDDTNSRGRQIDQLISHHYLCLLINDEKTYFHAPTRTFHSLDLAIYSPALLKMFNFEVEKDLHNSDHFPLLVSHVNGAGTHFRPPTYHFHLTDWDKFTRLAIITCTMVQNRAFDDAILNVTEAIRNAVDAAIPKTSSSIIGS
ncbi:RNA-directed DNA polymerase from mobile element jockey [Trichonephila clavipes]|nr:RNA-directed DNA polymerase from mobile element jockey [Trichonephila clavipes]